MIGVSSIQTSIELNDQFTSVLYSIIGSVNLAVCSIYDMQESMSADIDTSSIEGAMDEINQATAAINAMNEAMSNQTAPDISTQVHPNVQPDPVEIPVTWNTDGLDVFTGTGIDRFQQEVQSTNSMLEQLCSTQDAIARQAFETNIFPPEAFQNLNSLAVRIDMVRDRIQQIENNPVNIGTDVANAELEQLRAQLNRAVQEQYELNSAMQNMDVSAANDAYLRLSQTVSGTERYIRDNVDEQGRFNQEIQAGTQQANELTSTIKRAVGAYISIQSVGSALGISDELTQTISRLNLMNDGAQTTEELFNMIYASAKNTHAPIMTTASAIARMGNNAGAAFDSNVELIAFMEQVNKQFAIGGATATEQSNALLQLSQAMAAGALRGDELNSILDAAPGIARAIEENMGWAEGSIKSYAEEGAVTAEVVKNSLLNMADETNEAFESMPITFSQAMTDLQTDAVEAFQPVLQRMNEIANSEAFQEFSNRAVEAMQILSAVILDIFDMVGAAGGFVADNWSIIEPIIIGAAIAMGIYTAALLIGKGIMLACAAAQAIHAAMTSAWSVATFAATVQQQGLNAALLACPITWIIVLIIAVIAVTFALCNAIAELTGISDSGFGVICGWISVVIQFFKNLLLTGWNVSMGITNAILALRINMMTAFHNAISSVQAWWYDLLSTALTVIEGICAALNKLPFVEFDYSGISSAADDYAAKSAEAAASKEDYINIGDAFNAGFNTFDTFQDGWATDAFNVGASWGDGVADAVSNFSLSDFLGVEDLPNQDDYMQSLNDAIKNAGISDNIADISDNTGAIKDSMDISNEDLKYLRDIAEQEAINRFTTAEIKLDMVTNNNVSSDADLDGIVDGLTTKVLEAIEAVREG